ncbi:MAG: hypothetical protein FJX78_00885 [Armatimonadetes bacterium]|nr:hypothetical protein [Armatimonadota bacterium]
MAAGDVSVSPRSRSGTSGLAAQPRGPLNLSIPFFAPDTFQYQRDIVRARRLLQEAGYGRDKPLEVSFGYVGPSGVQRRTAEILQGYLGEVGIKVVPRPMTFPSLLGLMQKPETVPDIFNLNNHSAYPDPDYTFARFWHSCASGGGTGLNGGFYKNAEVDRLIDEARGISDAAKRKELYKCVQQLITDDAPAIWIANPVTVVVHRPYVKGFQ